MLGCVFSDSSEMPASPSSPARRFLFGKFNIDSMNIDTNDDDKTDDDIIALLYHHYISRAVGHRHRQHLHRRRCLLIFQHNLPPFHK